MTDESIRSLTQRIDPDGQIWQICAVCIEWIRFEDLVLDPADGLRWDICVGCAPEAGVSAGENEVSSDDTGLSAPPCGGW